MKKTILIISAMLATVILVSCGVSKKNSTSPSLESTVKTQANLEGEQVRIEEKKYQGLEMSEALSDDGTSMIQRPYKWYAGVGIADNKQVDIEIAQREEYSTISRIISNAVMDNAKRGNVINNGELQQAITTHWEQFSTSLQRACEPFGNTTIEYNTSTKKYTATAKIAIRGDRFTQLLNTAGNFKPTGFSGTELDQFIEINKAIMAAAKGE